LNPRAGLFLPSAAYTVVKVSVKGGIVNKQTKHTTRVVN
jgi:hypothetical protein